MDKLSSTVTESAEKDVQQLFDQFLASIHDQLSQLKAAMARRNHLSESLGQGRIASLVDRLWSRVDKRHTDTEVIAQLAPSIWRESARYFNTLSPTEIIRLADEKKWPIELTTEGSDDTLQASSPRILVRVVDIPAFNGAGTPDYAYSSLVIVFADSHISCATDDINPVRILPAGNDLHEQLRTKGLHARNVQR